MTVPVRSHADVDQALAHALLNDRDVPLVGHLVALALVLLIVWGELPLPVLVPWTAVLIAIIAIRCALWHRARRVAVEPRTVFRMARITLAALGLAWGVGLAVAAQHLPDATLATVLVAMAGLLAAGVSTLLAERWAFPIYVMATFGSVLAGVAWAVRDGRQVELILLGLVFTAFMIRVHQQSHAMLVGQLNAAHALRVALQEVKTLKGYLRVCANCRRISTEDDRWEPLESYVRRHSHAEFSHGICPDCARSWQ